MIMMIWEHSLSTDMDRLDLLFFSLLETYFAFLIFPFSSCQPVSINNSMPICSFAKCANFKASGINLWEANLQVTFEPFHWLRRVNKNTHSLCTGTGIGSLFHFSTNSMYFWCSSCVSSWQISVLAWWYELRNWTDPLWAFDNSWALALMFPFLYCSTPHWRVHLCHLLNWRPQLPSSSEPEDSSPPLTSCGYCGANCEFSVTNIKSMQGTHKMDRLLC